MWEEEEGVVGRFEDALGDDTLLEKREGGYSQRRSQPRAGGTAEPHRESIFSMSACEYAAPTTRLVSRVVFLGAFTGVVAPRQKGEAELKGGSASPRLNCI